MNNRRNQFGERMPCILSEGDAPAVRRASAARTRRSFLAGAAAAAAGYGVWRWIDNSAPIGRLQAVLRHSLQWNAALDRKLFAERGLAPEYPLARAVPLRLNGVVGLQDQLSIDSYRLQVVGVRNAQSSPRYAPDVTAWEYRYLDGAQATAPLAEDLKSAPGNGGVTKTGSTTQPSIADRFKRMQQQISGKRHLGNAEAGPSYSSLNIGTPGLLLTLADLAQLPRKDLVTEFKCVEGWSQITHWSGYRLRDFLDAYPPEKINGREPRFLYMETPSGDFYCGYDMQAARHPQSLLVTEMSGQPLTQLQGAPLRLHMPIKYGYKQLKRIGLIAYTDSKPDDYWTKLGFDWYAGL